MKIRLTILLFCFISTFSYSQCFAPTNLFAANINYYNAEANWNSSSGTHYYRIRYKEISGASWLYANNIDSSLNTQLLTNLNPLSDYIWQIKAYCDTTNTNTSNWSIVDTFTTITNSCPNTDSIYTTNINFNNALANWSAILGANRYKVRYKNIGSSTWSNLGPIYHPTDSIIIPLLLPNTSYEWQVLSYHDSTILLGSLWSASDTFTTTSFVAAAFNPLVINTLSSLECNVQTELKVRMTQTANEPDIETGSIISDGGAFDLSGLSINDVIGSSSGWAGGGYLNANMTLMVDAILTSDKISVKVVHDSTGLQIGDFTIENENGGIKIEVLGSPNDGNNYTSGYISELYFTDLFVNPQNAGPLHFFIDINSELNDQIYTTDTVQIWCNTTEIIESTNSKEIIAIYDALGRKTQAKINTLQFIKFSDGTIERRIFIKE
jgi:hypothetical protein